MKKKVLERLTAFTAQQSTAQQRFTKLRTSMNLKLIYL
jgi:hypothetical protein